MTDAESDWPDDPTGQRLPTPLLLVLGATLVVQNVLLVWSLGFRSGAGAPPSFVPLLVLALSGVAAVAIVVDARSAPGWWSPRWGYWAFGTLVFGVNLGVGLAYYLRRQEVLTASEPTPRWKWPTVAAAVLAAVTTMVYRGLFDSPAGLVAGTLAVLSLSIIGFGFGAALFDLRYVTTALEGVDVGWVMDGFHWPIMVVLLIPANVVFVLLYLYRRKRLFAAVSQANPGPGIADAAADGAVEAERRDDVD